MTGCTGLRIKHRGSLGILQPCMPHRRLFCSGLLSLLILPLHHAVLTFTLLLRHCNNRRSPPCCYSPHVTTLTRRIFVLTRPTWTKSILLPELVGDYNAGEVESLMKLAGPAMLSAVRIYIYNVPDLPLDCCFVPASVCLCKSARKLFLSSSVSLSKSC